MKLTQEHLHTLTSLTPVQAQQAAEIAPRLRMLHKNRTGRASVISFSAEAPYREDPFLKGKVLLVSAKTSYVESFEAFTREYGEEPVIVYVENLGFALGCHMEAAVKALEIYLSHQKGEDLDWTDIQKTSSYIEGKRLQQKIMIVTGGAQGFGLGTAQYAAREGAYLAIADINTDKAKQVSKELNEAYGPFCSIPVEMDVTDEQQVKAGIEKTAAFFGGIDVFHSNAGVLRAGASDTLSLEDFMYVTQINYTGYFICAKQAFILMKRQNEINRDYWMDIIQTNSKSGLTGSNKNCSYAGSKFGTIGLTQSFAMEMADYHIKVNSICPGNYLTGPLWSDPENGLFTQYLRTGKIPGAKTVEDLIRHYNRKVPMGRSCEAEDVAKAVLYLIEQNYETGQALPVSGGQLMLR